MRSFDDATRSPDLNSPATGVASPRPEAAVSISRVSDVGKDRPLTAAAFNQFLAEHGNRLQENFLAWAHSCGISRADARDAAHVILCRVFQRIKDGVASTRYALAPVLFKAAKREAIRRHKKLKKVVPPEQLDACGQHLWCAEEEPTTAMLEALPAVIGQLPEADRRLLVLYHFKGYAQDEIASQLGLQPRTVGRRLSNARQRLGRLLIGMLLSEGFDRAELPVLPLLPD